MQLITLDTIEHAWLNCWFMLWKWAKLKYWKKRTCSLCSEHGPWIANCTLLNTHSKKCWVKYNPVLVKYWTEHMLGCFQPTVGLNVQPNLLGSNPTAGFVHILPSAGLYLTQHFLECRKSLCRKRSGSSVIFLKSIGWLCKNNWRLDFLLVHCLMITCYDLMALFLQVKLDLWGMCVECNFLS